MISKEALKSICLECEREKGKNKIACPFRSISNEYCEEYDTIEKDLDQLEEYRKIEEELGCPLKVVLKALKQMFVFRKDNVKTKIELLGLHIKSNKLYLFGFVKDTVHAVYLSLKDYGKTWALTKEELENDN